MTKEEQMAAWACMDTTECTCEEPEPKYLDLLCIPVILVGMALLWGYGARYFLLGACIAGIITAAAIKWGL